MDSNRTSHVLVTVAVIGTLLLVLLFLRERYWIDNDSESIVWEENLPTHSEVKPVVTPTSNPAVGKFSPIIGDISKGDSVQLNYGTYEKTLIFCEKDKNFDTAWYFAEKVENCVDINELYVAGTRDFDVTLKNGVDFNLVTNLNNQYDVKIKFNVLLDNGSRHIGLDINEGSSNNALALARIYYETGYFSSIITVEKTYRGD